MPCVECRRGDANTRRSRPLWWREKPGHLKLAEIDAATIVQYRNKLLHEPYVKAKLEATGSTLADGEVPRVFKHGPKDGE